MEFCKKFWQYFVDPKPNIFHLVGVYEEEI